MAEAYPLHWPTGWPRTEPRSRKTARFGKREHNGRWPVNKPLTIADAMERLKLEIIALKATNLTVSSNLQLRMDGLPRSGQRDPEDPGVAVYFMLKGRPVNLACDLWDRPADNIAAIAKHIEALRGQDRWGVGTTAQAFRGYEALPAPGQTAPLRWRQVLELGEDATLEDAVRAHRAALKRTHPDMPGGSAEAFQAVQAAIEQARTELS